LDSHAIAKENATEAGPVERRSVALLGMLVRLHPGRRARASVPHFTQRGAADHRGRDSQGLEAGGRHPGLLKSAKLQPRASASAVCNRLTSAWAASENARLFALWGPLSLDKVHQKQEPTRPSDGPAGAHRTRNGRRTARDRPVNGRGAVGDRHTTGRGPRADRDATANEPRRNRSADRYATAPDRYGRMSAGARWGGVRRQLRPLESRPFANRAAGPAAPRSRSRSRAPGHRRSRAACTRPTS